MTALQPYARVASVFTGLPKHYASQEQLITSFRKLWATQHFNTARLEELHRNVQVQGRYLAAPIDDVIEMRGFAQRNAVFQKVALDLGEEVVRGALLAADLTPADVDHLFFVTVTGLSTPSIDARLVNRLGLRPDVRRTPIFGLGCLAGAAGLARAADALRGYPRQTAVLLSVELCTLTLQREDLSVANIISTGLFGDGAAAVVLRGAEAGRAPPGPGVVASESVFYPGTEDMMGWDFVDTGFKVVLSAKVPELVRGNIRNDVDRFLEKHGLGRRDIKHWAIHTGGPKVLEAFEAALELPEQALRPSWESLERTGNLSSASVLFVLREHLVRAEAKPGDFGLLAAMGPGFCAELVLLRW